MKNTYKHTYNITQALMNGTSDWAKLLRSEN